MAWAAVVPFLFRRILRADVSMDSQEGTWAGAALCGLFLFDPRI